MFIENIKGLECPSIVSSMVDKIAGADMVPVFLPQPNTGTIIEPQTASWLLLSSNFQPLAPPQTFNPLGIHNQLHREVKACESDLTDILAQRCERIPAY